MLNQIQVHLKRARVLSKVLDESTWLYLEVQTNETIKGMTESCDVFVYITQGYGFVNVLICL